MRRTKLPLYYCQAKVSKMDNIQIMVALIIVGLIAILVFLRKKWNKPATPNLPAVSEDVNLPMVKNDLENKGPQQ